MTVCNMTIEAGARAGLIAPDEKTFKYLEGKTMSPKGENWKKALEFWKTLYSDKDCKFDKEVNIEGKRYRTSCYLGNFSSRCLSNNRSSTRSS